MSFLNAILHRIFCKDVELDSLKRITFKLENINLDTKKLQKLNDELILAQKKILEQEEQIRIQLHALNELDSILIITDLDANIIYANDAFCKAFEYNITELIGQNTRILNSSQHPSQFFENMWNTIKSGNVWSDIIISKSKTGKIVKHYTTITPIFNGKIKYFIAIKDINEEIK